MAEVLGLSAASATIAVVQQLIRLQTVFSTSVESLSSSSQDVKVVQGQYQYLLLRLQELSIVLKRQSSVSNIIPMHIFEQLFLLLRDQLLHLEELQKQRVKSLFILRARARGSQLRKLSHDLDRFIKYFETIPSILLHTPVSSSSPHATTDLSLGLKVIVTPQNTDIKADIIFIHGLQTRSLATWSGFNVFWPRDLLPDQLPNARIMTFDYDLGPTFRVNRARYLSQTKSLIEDIGTHIQDDDTHRPLIFCCHSFGGLLLKSALAYCQKAQDFDEICQEIISRTRGTLFFGVPTPTRGSESWFGEYINKILGTEYGIDNSISIDLVTKFSIESEEMLRTDSKMFDDTSSSHGWSSYVSYEDKPTLTRSGPVFITSGEDDYSGNFDTLPGDHYTMCRFQTKDDRGFEMVSFYFELICTGRPVPVRRSMFSGSEILKARVKASEILETSQNYNECFDRYVRLLRHQLGPRYNMSQSNEQPARWLKSNQRFQSWMNGDIRRLTICGPPGSGKTYLTKHILHHLMIQKDSLNLKSDGEILVHFTDYSELPISVLRSFLLQLLKSNADLFKQVYQRTYKPEPPVIYDDLEQLLLDLISNSKFKSLVIIIHGIHKLGELQRDQLGVTISRLISARGKPFNSKVLFTTRTCDIFGMDVEDMLSKLGLKHIDESIIELKNVALKGESTNELKTYVQRCVSSMRNSGRMPSALRESIERCLVAKITRPQETQDLELYNVSHPDSLLGNFLWIFLVTRLIGRERSPKEIRRALGAATEVLDNLDSVYHELISSTPSDINITRILRFVKYCRRPMSVQELEFATTVTAEHDSAQMVLEETQLLLDVILETDAGSLVQLRNGTVSLIHSSLNDYLDPLPSFSPATSHRELAEACIWSLSLGTLRRNSLAPASAEVHATGAFMNTSLHPFMRYASEFWFQHVRLALESDDASNDNLFGLTEKFVQSESCQGWLRWYTANGNELLYPPDRANTYSRIHVYAALNILGYPKVFNPLSIYLNQRDSMGRSPMFYAAANDAQATIDFILNHHNEKLKLDVEDPDLLCIAATKTDRKLLEKILDNQSVRVPNNLVFTTIDGRHWSAFELLKRHLEMPLSPLEQHDFWNELADDNGGMLHHLVRARNLDLVRSFLAQGLDPNDERSGKTPIHLAAEIGGELIIEALIDAGGDFNCPDQNSNTPLHYATEVGSLKVVRYLTDISADVSALNEKHQSALHLAAKAGHDEIVRLLIEAGAEVNVRSTRSVTPLQLACASGWNNVVRRLLDHGADHSLADEKHRTPLHLAAANGSREAAIVLLESGAQVNASDQDLRTPLHAAASRGAVDLVLTLIERGADLSAVDKNGKSPLHCAVESTGSSAKIVQLLVERGADVHYKQNEHQKSALELAVGNSIVYAVLLNEKQKPNPDRGLEKIGSWMSDNVLTEQPQSLLENDVDGASQKKKGYLFSAKEILTA